jgi:hypothetical protein
MEDLVGGAVSVKKNERDFLAAEARFLGKLNNPEDLLLTKVLDGEGKPAFDSFAHQMEE